MKKALLILTHVSGEIALIALHPEKGDKDYREHIAKELEELARMIRKAKK